MMQNVAATNSATVYSCRILGFEFEISLCCYLIKFLAWLKVVLPLSSKFLNSKLLLLLVRFFWREDRVEVALILFEFSLLNWKPFKQGPRLLFAGKFVSVWLALLTRNCKSTRCTTYITSFIFNDTTSDTIRICTKRSILRHFCTVKCRKGPN